MTAAGRTLARGGLAVVASFVLVPAQFMVYVAGEWNNAALWTRATVRGGDMALALGVQAAVVALPAALFWRSAGTGRSLLFSFLGVVAVIVLRAALTAIPGSGAVRAAVVDVGQFVAVPFAAASVAGWAVARLWSED